MISPALLESADCRGLSQSTLESLAELGRWFGADFVAVDAEGIVHGTDETTNGLLRHCSKLVATAHELRWPQILRVDDPLIILAIPFSSDRNERLVAMATFVTRHAKLDDDLTLAAQWLNRSTGELVDWVNQRAVWTCHTLILTANALLARLFSENTPAARDEQNEQLTESLQLTYERVGQTIDELNVIFKLTDLLKTNARNQQIYKKVLGWLGDVLPVEGLAIRLSYEQSSGIAPAAAGASWLSHGNCPISENEFQELVTEFSAKSRYAPLVVNPNEFRPENWRFSQVRQLVAAPIETNSCNLGWIAAFNHRADGELGTNEGRLMTSVGTILASHADRST